MYLIGEEMIRSLRLINLGLNEVQMVSSFANRSFSPPKARRRIPSLLIMHFVFLSLSGLLDELYY
jgi:hypothetical protein